MSTPVDTGAQAAQTMVAPVFLFAILSEAVRQRVDVGVMLRGLALDVADFEVPGMLLSHREAITVVRRALQLLSLSGQGIQLGQRAMVSERGAWRWACCRPPLWATPSGCRCGFRAVPAT